MERKSGQKYRMLEDCFYNHFKKGDVLTLDGKSSNNNITWFCVEKNKWGTGCIINFDVDLYELVETQDFQVGDVVEAFGVKGIVTNIDYTLSMFPVCVSFDQKPMRFMSDGKYLDWNKAPTLKLLERPVKEVTFETTVIKNGWNETDCQLLQNKITGKLLTPFSDKEVVVTVKLKA